MAASLGLEPTDKACIHAGLTGEGTEKGTDRFEGCSELQEIAGSWPGLPVPLKAAILAIVRSHRIGREGQPS